MGRAYDPLAATRALICQFDVTTERVLLFDGRPASPHDMKIFKSATSRLEELLQEMVDLEAGLIKPPVS